MVRRCHCLAMASTRWVPGVQVLCAGHYQPGYHLTNIAQAYHNEEGVGEAIKKYGVPHEELFIVTKVWIKNTSEEKAYTSILKSLKKLKCSYADILLIHQPFGNYYSTCHTMEHACHEVKCAQLV